MKLELSPTFEEGCCQVLLLISQRLGSEAGSERTEEVKDAVESFPSGALHSRNLTKS